MLGWVKGSVLRPILAVLDADEAEAFLARLAEGYRPSYPIGSRRQDRRSRSAGCSWSPGAVEPFFYGFSIGTRTALPYSVHDPS